MALLLLLAFIHSAFTYIIHQEKITLPTKLKLLDGVESNLMYIDLNNTIHRMHFTGNTLNELYPIQCQFEVNALELRNQQPNFGNGYYLMSGTNDILLIKIVNSTHENITVQTPDNMVTTSTGSNP